MENEILLSICIPTYNRAELLDQALNCIVKQATTEVEIIIVDGASTDNTLEIVNKYQVIFKKITYLRLESKGGIDIDLAKTVDLAIGRYCWLFGSDDLFYPGAINFMLSEIRGGEDIYLCDFTLCDINMNPIRHSKFLSHKRKKDLYKISDRKEFIEYLDIANSNNALLCYMSSIIFKRERWNGIGADSRFRDSAYSHVFTLLSLYKSSCILKYLPQQLVMNRGGNDSFSGDGIEKRYLIDLNGYLLLANTLFDNDIELKKSFLMVMTREHPWYRICKLRASIKSFNGWKVIREKLLEFGYSPKLLMICSLLGSVPFGVQLADYLNKTYPRSFVISYLRKFIKFSEREA